MNHLSRNQKTTLENEEYFAAHVRRHYNGVHPRIEKLIRSLSTFTSKTQGNAVTEMQRLLHGSMLAKGKVLGMQDGLLALYDTALTRKMFEQSTVTTRELLGMALYTMSGIVLGTGQQECPTKQCSEVIFEGSKIVILC